MRLSALLIIAMTFTAAATVSLVAANFSVTLIEENSEIGVRDALDAKEMTWAEVQADGLQVTLSGTAPDEVEGSNAVERQYHGVWGRLVGHRIGRGARR